MSSWDKAPEGFYEFGDGIWAPAHAIICNSKWTPHGGRHVHTTVAEVRECFQAARDEAAGIQVWPCSWLLEGRCDDGSAYTYECEAPTRYTDDPGSYACTVGHDHIALEVQAELGIEYASDDAEALALTRAGRQVLNMAGAPYLF